jgi:glycosyltransferase involved in cell wall biosynthesis
MKPKGRALVLANRLPYPLDDGWNVRTFHVVRNVARLADVTLLVFHAGGEDAQLQAAREALGAGVRVVPVTPPTMPTSVRLALGALTRWPLHVWNQESAAMRETIRRLVATERFDYVLTVATFFERYLDLFPEHAVRVVDTHNLDSLLIARYARTPGSLGRRLYAAVTARKLRALEARVFERADLVWVCSEPEVPLAHEIAPGVPVRVAPNGVDTMRFRPAEGIAPVPNRLLFFGKLDYYPNVDGLQHIVDDILPLVQRERPDVELRVVGAGDRTAVEAIARRNAAVHVVGRVDDLGPELAQAAVVVVPLRAGGGTRLKILEALSAARPLVSTRIGAEGLGLTSGHDSVLADAPEEFAAAVLRLLADPAAAEALGAAGRETVVARYDWRSIGDVIARDLEETRAARAATARPGLGDAPVQAVPT